MLKLLNVVVEFKREAPVMLAERIIEADLTARVLERLVAQRSRIRDYLRLSFR